MRSRLVSCNFIVVVWGAGRAPEGFAFAGTAETDVRKFELAGVAGSRKLARVDF
jgi:hypothetical protein